MISFKQIRINEWAAVSASGIIGWIQDCVYRYEWFVGFSVPINETTERSVFGRQGTAANLGEAQRKLIDAAAEYLERVN